MKVSVSLLALASFGWATVTAVQTKDNLRLLTGGGVEAGGSLGECEFDCDEDSDCGPGLLCADRHEAQLEAIGLDKRKAYCGDVGSDADEVCFDASLVLLGLCESDCDEDSDCGPGLLCADRHEGELEAIGLDRKRANCGELDVDWDDKEVCFDASLLLLHVCESGCKEDSDCGPGLLCTDRHKDELEATGLDPMTAICGEADDVVATSDEAVCFREELLDRSVCEDVVCNSSTSPTRFSASLDTEVASSLAKCFTYCFRPDIEFFTIIDGRPIPAETPDPANVSVQLVQTLRDGVPSPMCTCLDSCVENLDVRSLPPGWVFTSSLEVTARGSSCDDTPVISFEPVEQP